VAAVERRPRRPVSVDAHWTTMSHVSFSIAWSHPEQQRNRTARLSRNLGSDRAAAARYVPPAGDNTAKHESAPPRVLRLSLALSAASPPRLHLDHDLAGRPQYGRDITETLSSSGRDQTLNYRAVTPGRLVLPAQHAWPPALAVGSAVAPLVWPVLRRRGDPADGFVLARSEPFSLPRVESLLLALHDGRWVAKRAAPTDGRAPRGE
jgi:hypothetical protein